MSPQRCPVQCILPPHILDALLESSNARVRDAALATVKISSYIRGRRSVLGGVAAALASGAHAGLQRKIFDCHNEENEPPSGDLARSEGQGPTGNAAVDEAYDWFGATYKFYSDVFHRDSIDGQGLPLIGYVDYGEGFNNAFWDGAEMVFGEGDGVVFQRFTRSLDVVGHELTHGVTERTAGLVYHRQPGALNESMSDVFGSLVKQYKLQQTASSADWLIGAELLAPGIHGKALRSMADPGSAYDDPKLGGKDPQPKHMDDYLDLPDTKQGDFGGVHINSGIPNHAFYLVATQIGGNAWEAAGHIWFATLQQLSPNSQFEDCANISSQVAATLYGTNSSQRQAVVNAWNEVGVTVGGGDAAPAIRKRAKGKPPEVDLLAFKKQLARLAQQLQNTVDSLG